MSQNLWDIEYPPWAVSLWAMSNKFREGHGNSVRVGNTGFGRGVLDHQM